MKPKSLLPANKKRRYYLHREVKKTFKLDVPSRIVFVPSVALEDPEVMDARMKGYLGELYSFGYVMQLTFDQPINY
ncbi:hypothetical protein [Pontibacter sp. H249]|uniref:hypothetical protein n=1 Tax=Pontibacter sp. H249 TaxID=3133420 RepID=UPI0030C5E8FF